MSFLWLRHFRYVFVAYVDVFVSHCGMLLLVSWLSRWFCLLRCSGSCHSYHVAVPRHGMLLAKAWPFPWRSDKVIAVSLCGMYFKSLLEN